MMHQRKLRVNNKFHNISVEKRLDNNPEACEYVPCCSLWRAFIEEKGMREFPIGSVCQIVEGYPEYVGKECCIQAGLAEREGVNKEGTCTKRLRYEVTVQGYGDQIFNAMHSQLRLKRLPPDEKFERFMGRLNTPVDVPKHEDDLV